MKWILSLAAPVMAQMCSQPDWVAFRSLYVACPLDCAHSVSVALSSIILPNLARVLECPVGVIAGFALIGRLSPPDRAYRAYQLAMVYIYVLRNRNRISPESEIEWNVSTDEIIGQIGKLRVWNNIQYPFLPKMHTSEKFGLIGIVTMCIYPPDTQLIIASETPRNRYMYARRHGYEALVFTDRIFASGDVQHGKLALLLSLLGSGLYEWLMWMDCDSVIINGAKSIESIIARYEQPATNLIITEELLGLSSANFLIKNTAWSIDFLQKAFDICANQLPLFGDQDGIIVASMYPSLELDSHITVIPQNEINAYDALNAHHMGIDAYSKEDLLVTFPQCRESSCNPLFRAAFDAVERGGFDVPIKDRSPNQRRVFGPI